MHGQSPSNLRGPTPSPLTSPAANLTQLYRTDEAHRRRLMTYPYIEMSRKDQEARYPYGYTSPYPNDNELSPVYKAFADMTDGPKQSQHPQGIRYTSGSGQSSSMSPPPQYQQNTQMASQSFNAAMANMGNGTSSGMSPSQAIQYETADQFMRSMSIESERLDRMSYGASIPGGPA